MTIPIIMWEQWKDPYCIEEVEESPEEWQEAPTPKNNYNGKLLFTPLGVVPLTEESMPSKVFNFWTANTNFNITTKIAEMISKVDGVEVLTVFTRYRFRIGVGKAFDELDVRRSINNHLNTLLNKKNDSR
jgi:hypothetical protein